MTIKFDRPHVARVPPSPCTAVAGHAWNVAGYCPSCGQFKRILRGWIYVPEREAGRAKLEAIGVKVGTWDPALSTFEGCEVDEAASNKLDPLWGEFIWRLEP